MIPNLFCIFTRILLNSFLFGGVTNLTALSVSLFHLRVSPPKLFMPLELWGIDTGHINMYAALVNFSFLSSALRECFSVWWKLSIHACGIFERIVLRGLRLVVRAGGRHNAFSRRRRWREQQTDTRIIYEHSHVCELGRFLYYHAGAAGGLYNGKLQ